MNIPKVDFLEVKLRELIQFRKEELKTMDDFDKDDTLHHLRMALSHVLANKLIREVETGLIQAPEMLTNH